MTAVSKVSRRLTQAIAPEVVEHIYKPRLGAGASDRLPLPLRAQPGPSGDARTAGHRKARDGPRDRRSPPAHRSGWSVRDHARPLAGGCVLQRGGSADRADERRHRRALAHRSQSQRPLRSNRPLARPRRPPGFDERCERAAPHPARPGRIVRRRRHARPHASAARPADHIRVLSQRNRLRARARRGPARRCLEEG